MNDGGHDGDMRLLASVELAWGLRELPAKGPRRGLSLGRIVEAAVNVADCDGLTAVSMNRVAVDLGSKAMSLYRYVASKDELLMLMLDMVCGEIPATTEPGKGWRAGLSRWAGAYRAVLHRHPWALRIPLNGPSVMPNQVAWLEDGLRSMGATSLNEEEKLSTLLLISGFVRAEATLAADISAAALASGSKISDVMPAHGRLLKRLIDPATFPALHRALESGAFDIEDDVDDEFNFGLDRILDGVDVLVRMGDRPGGGSTP